MKKGLTTLNLKANNDDIYRYVPELFKLLLPKANKQPSLQNDISGRTCPSRVLVFLRVRSVAVQDVLMLVEKNYLKIMFYVIHTSSAAVRLPVCKISGQALCKYAMAGLLINVQKETDKYILCSVPS